MTEEDTARNWFPGLAGDPALKKTSDSTTDYNCIAWAADDDANWWWPPLPPPIPTRAGQYWPLEAPREETVSAFMSAFETIGYEFCDDGTIEHGYEKIVLYVDTNGRPKHAARQLETGIWTSKLGDFIDILHSNPDGLSGQKYGIPVLFMRRKRQP